MVSDTEFDGDAYYAIHEVWYSDDGEPDSYAIDSLINDDSVEGLREILELIELGINKEVIDIKYFDKFEEKT